MTQLKKAFELIEKEFDESEIDSCGPISDQTIANAERALQTTLPKTYKAFLKKYGCEGIQGLEIYGLIKDENFDDKDFLLCPAPNSIWTTLRYHQDYNHPLYIPIIYNLGDGTKYGLDTSQMNKEEECPVVAWHGAIDEGDKLEVIALDFGTWFLEMVEEEIAYKKEN